MAKQLKIGFIQAKNEIDVQWYRPLSFGYLKAYIEKDLGERIEMQFLESLRDIDNYNILGISSTSQDFSIAKEMARSIKRQNREIIAILGGHHITYLPETLPEEFDIGVIGEGEETFLELIRYLFKHHLILKPDNLRSIRGIIFRENGNIVITPRRDLISSLDNIPFPYRSKGSAPYLFSSRGCPYRCRFCSSSAFWGITRFFSAGYVIKEIEIILEQFPELKNISVWDDLFIVNKPRFKKFVEMVEEKEINKRVNFTLAVRANLVNDELCEALKRINVSSVGFGAESGSDRILNILNKGVTVKQNQETLDLLYKYKVPVSCSFIVGIPTETEKDVQLTYEFILKNIIERKLSPNPSVNILMPMPGTKVWGYAIEKGLIDTKNMDWNRLSIFASYRNSKIKDFSDWAEYRRKNNSIYLAEETLPQERLYELMYIYDNILKGLERNRELEEKEKILESILTSKTWRFTAPLRRIFSMLRGKHDG